MAADTRREEEEAARAAEARRLRLAAETAREEAEAKARAEAAAEARERLQSSAPDAARSLDVVQAPDDSSSTEATLDESGQSIGSSAEGMAECVVCLDEEQNHIVVPCGHFCLCEGCASKVGAAGGECPVCRTPATLILRVWRVS
jgi:hypothetical protein